MPLGKKEMDLTTGKQGEEMACCFCSIGDNVSRYVCYGNQQVDSWL
jgi:hypothetical protein